MSGITPTKEKRLLYCPKCEYVSDDFAVGILEGNRLKSPLLKLVKYCGLCGTELKRASVIVKERKLVIQGNERVGEPTQG